MGSKRIPIKAAKEISEKYNHNQVIICTFDKDEGRTHVVTYGKTLKDCDEAAKGGNFVKKALGWPDNLCNAKPNRIKKSQKFTDEELIKITEVLFYKFSGDCEDELPKSVYKKFDSDNEIVNEWKKIIIEKIK